MAVCSYKFLVREEKKSHILRLIAKPWKLFPSSSIPFSNTVVQRGIDSCFLFLPSVIIAAFRGLKQILLFDPNVSVFVSKEKEGRILFFLCVLFSRYLVTFLFIVSCILKL